MAMLNGSKVENRESGTPYVFESEVFSTIFMTQEGSLRGLKKFDEISKDLRGIEKYRMLIFEANPLSFLTPMHWDSDIIFFVGQGKGTISLVFENKRESYNIEKGHLMTIPAGVTFYIINSDDNDKLILSMFLISIAKPGDFTPFIVAGCEEQESYLNAFSAVVLETAYNASYDKRQNIFSKQTKGVILKATKEQIMALTADSVSEGDGNFGPCQIYSYLRESAECGKLFMVDHNQYKKLQDFNMFISFCCLPKEYHVGSDNDIKFKIDVKEISGCMISPFISTRATKIIMVVKGRGKFEMAASNNGEEGSTATHYKKIRAELEPGVVLVIPPGHPMVLRASPDDVLESICYEVTAKGNQKFSLGGKVNVMKNIQKEAKELAFATSSEEVDNVIDNQKLFFMKYIS